MDFSVVEDLSTYDNEALAAKITEGETALDALLDLPDPTEADVVAAEGIMTSLRILREERDNRGNAAAARAARMTAVREAASVQPPEPEPEPDEPGKSQRPDSPPGHEDDPGRGREDAPGQNKPEVTPQLAVVNTTVASLSSRIAPPAVPDRAKSPIVITAAADVSGFAAGAVMGDMEAVAEGFLSKSSGFPQAYGIKGAQPVRYPVSQFNLEFPEELTASGDRRDWDVVSAAADEHRLPGESLTAAAGWCAPSETIYDLCGGGSTEGLWDAPEIQVNRGGVKFTRGPDFSALYDAPFYLTEAQVIAGTAKTCYEIPCPSFEEIRLDASGICLTSPLLLEAGYPEVVAAFVREAMIAHQHAISGRLLTKALSLATDVTGLGDRGSSASNVLDQLEYIAVIIRSSFRLSEATTVEVALPWWAKAAIRSDLSMRTGVDLLGVSDGDISAYFSARGLSVQFLHNYQPLDPDEVGYPATVEALVYPAGTFVKGTSSVISLDAVYDAASLKQNTRIALFFEQGVLLMTRCYTAYKVTIDLCNAGTTGAASNTDCFVAAVGP